MDLIQLDDGSYINAIDKQYFNSNFLYSDDIVYFNNNALVDSIKLEIQLHNNIENYSIRENVSVNKNIDDKIKPEIIKLENINNKLLITFSEPISINKTPEELNVFTALHPDSTLVVLNYFIENPMMLSISDTLKIINEIKINNKLVTDISKNNNILVDSLLIVPMINEEDTKNEGGNIYGKIIYEGKKNIIVEAISNNGERFQAVPNKYNEFIFLNLDVDEYQIWSYENLNSINDNYFNGKLSPIKYSAKFNYYDEKIQTRSKWDIENIRIRIE